MNKATDFSVNVDEMTWPVTQLHHEVGDRKKHPAVSRGHFSEH